MISNQRCAIAPQFTRMLSHPGLDSWISPDRTGELKELAHAISFPFWTTKLEWLGVSFGDSDRNVRRHQSRDFEIEEQTCSNQNDYADGCKHSGVSCLNQTLDPSWSKQRPDGTKNTERRKCEECPETDCPQHRLCDDARLPLKE